LNTDVLAVGVLADLGGDLDVVCPGQGLVVGHVHTGGIESLRVGKDGVGVDTGGQTEGLTLQVTAVGDEWIQAGLVQLLEVVEVQQSTSVTVFTQVTLFLHGDVGGVVGSGVGGQPVPVGAPVGVFPGDPDVGVLGLEVFDDLLNGGVPIIGPPTRKTASSPLRNLLNRRHRQWPP